MKTISAIFILAAAGCAVDESSTNVATATQASTSSVVYHTTWSGGGASAESYRRNDVLMIDASENLATHTASLSFEHATSDPTSFTCITDPYFGFTFCFYTRFVHDYGWGAIPASDFHTTGSAAWLHTTVPSDSFTLNHCVSDLSTGTFNDCTTMDGGDIDIKWGPDGNYSTSMNGTQETRYAAFGFRTSGIYDKTSAHAEGTLLGLAVDAMGSFTTTRSTTVTKDVVAYH